MGALPRNSPRCDVCEAKLGKNGRTNVGRVRWRCRRCGASSTQNRLDVTKRAEMSQFQNWILGKASQREAGSDSGRSFRGTIAWCWDIQVPLPVVTGEVYRLLRF